MGAQDDHVPLIKATQHCAPWMRLVAAVAMEITTTTINYRALHAQGGWLGVTMASAPMFLLSQARANTLLKAKTLIRCAARVKHALWVSKSALLMSWPSHNTSHIAPPLLRCQAFWMDNSKTALMALRQKHQKNSFWMIHDKCLFSI